jgi:hypothetical protein
VYNVTFDALYWSFGAVMLLALLATLARSVVGLREGSQARTRAEATLVAAVGALLALVAGFGFNALRPLTGDLLYQQSHFAAFYVAFGLVLWAFDRVGMIGSRETEAGRNVRTLTWGAYGLATVIALAGLLTPDGYRIVTQGDVRYVQQPLFFLPPLVALSVGAAWLPSWALGQRPDPVRRWFALLAAFMLLGMLREATIIPSTDQPVLDLLLAFAPFTLATLCLCRAASLGSEPGPIGGAAPIPVGVPRPRSG